MLKEKINDSDSAHKGQRPEFSVDVWRDEQGRLLYASCGSRVVVIPTEPLERAA